MKIFVQLGLLLFFQGIYLGSHAQQQLAAPAFKSQFEADKTGVLLDVRTPEEFAQGYINGAKNINWNDKLFTQRTDSLSTKNNIYVYCLSGGRSAKAAHALRSKGFTVYELEGGMLKWRAAGLPEVKEGASQNGLTLSGFQQLLQTPKKVLVDFYAEWCAPCKLMEPYLKEIANKMKEQVDVVRVDVDKNPELAQLLNVSEIPVLMIYKAGKVKWQALGYVPKKVVLKQLK